MAAPSPASVASTRSDVAAWMALTAFMKPSRSCQMVGRALESALALPSGKALARERAISWKAMA